MGKLYEGGYNYSRLTKAYQKFPTEKQLKYIADLKATCEKIGVDISGLNLSTETKRDATTTINRLHGILARNGYDIYGHETKTYYMEEGSE